MEDNLKFEDLNDMDKKSIFKREGFKTALTVLAILLIPAVAFGWNFISGRDKISDIININKEEKSNNNNEEVSEDTEYGNSEINELPETSSDITYKVAEGDTLESISISVCGDKSFYLKNIDKKIKVGDVIKVNCL